MPRITLAVAAAATSLALGHASAQAPAGDSRAPGAMSFTLEISSPPGATGSVQKVAGGYAYGEVVEPHPGSDGLVHKHLAAIRYEPLDVRVDPGSVGGLLAMALKSPAAATGRLVPMDNAARAVGELQFSNALVSRIVIPALDVSSRAPCAVDVSFELLQVRTVRGAGGDPRAPVARGSGCMASHFQVSIPGLEDATRYVTHVDSIVMSRPVVTDNAGQLREPTKHPTRWSFGDVTITVPAAYGAKLYDWYQDFVVAGRDAEANERTLDLHLRAANGSDVLTLHASGVGLVSVHPVFAQSGDAAPLVEATFYVDQWQVQSYARSAMVMPERAQRLAVRTP